MVRVLILYYEVYAHKCRTKGFGAGAFFSMMSSSFAYDDPLLRTELSTRQKTTEMFREMGKGMLRSGKAFGRVGALYAGIECVIESVCYRFIILRGLISAVVPC